MFAVRFIRSLEMCNIKLMVEIVSASAISKYNISQSYNYYLLISCEATLIVIKMVISNM